MVRKSRTRTRRPARSTLTSDPGGGTCPKTLAERPFAPSYTAKSDSTKAGAYSPFQVHIGRPDGQQELKVVNVTLPKGLTGKLAGIPYCSEAELAAAAASSGKAEQAQLQLLVGKPDRERRRPRPGTGSGAAQARRQGVTSPVPTRARRSRWRSSPRRSSGPYDLGTVVVRVALNVNPETAQINAVSDPIPNVFGGVKLDIRSIDVNVDRSKFMLNPTNCAAQATSGDDQRRRRRPGQPGRVQLLRGQRAVPGDRLQQARLQAEAAHAALRPDQAGEEPADPGDPGSTRRRRQHQPHRADAAALAVPRPEPHQDRLHEAAAGGADSARRTRSTATPKRRRRCSSSKLKGPVYLVSSKHKLPDLLADLRGQVNIQLRRRDQLQARRAEDRVQRAAGRPGEEVHPEHAGRQEEPPAVNSTEPAARARRRPS